MVQLFPIESDTCRPDPVVVPAIVVFTLIIISLVWIGKLGASLENDKNYRLSDPDMSLVLRWIKTTGKSTIVRASVAQGFGLPDSDVPVIERGFRAEGEQFTHVCAIGSTASFENLVFFSSVDEADGSATVWQTDQTGKLLGTVVFSGAKVENVPNSRFGAEFRSERDYFLRKARTAKSQRDSRVTRSYTRLACRTPQCDSLYTLLGRWEYDPCLKPLRSSSFLLEAHRQRMHWQPERLAECAATFC